MNKLLVVLIISTVIMSGLVGLLFYQINEIQTENSELKGEIVEVENQRDKLQSIIDNHTNVVNITEFTVTDFGPYVGLTICSNAHITIQNYGINDVTNLVLTLENADVPNLNKTITVDIIHSGEKIEVNKEVFWNLGLSESFNATLLLNEEILDTSATTFSYD